MEQTKPYQTRERVVLRVMRWHSSIIVAFCGAHDFWN